MSLLLPSFPFFKKKKFPCARDSAELQLGRSANYQNDKVNSNNNERTQTSNTETTEREREREVQINISRAESEHRGRGRRTPCRLGGGDGFGYNCRRWMETIKQHGEGGADGCSSGVDMLHSLKTPPGVRGCII